MYTKYSLLNLRPSSHNILRLEEYRILMYVKLRFNNKERKEKKKKKKKYDDIR